MEIDESAVTHLDAVVDRVIVGRAHEKAVRAAIASTLLVGDGLMQVSVGKGASKGLDWKMILMIAGAAIVALFVFKRA